ncbi:MAG: HlyD family efflux transporter periplasmic adaptor subunit [Pirellulaceae bacterium]
MRKVLAFAVLALATSSASAQRSSFLEGEMAPPNALVKVIHDVRVPAEVEGKITEIRVGEGHEVEEGGVIAIVDDSKAALALKLKTQEETEARLNAENDVNLRDARNAAETAIAEYKSYKGLEAEGAVPYWEMEKKRLEADRAVLRIELAEMQQEIAETQHKAKQYERQMAELEVDLRQVTAPFAGFVEKRIAQLGEWVQPGTPVLQLVQLDRLRIEGDIDGFSIRGPAVRGAPVTVEVFITSGESRQLEGKIGFVSSQMDINQRFRVWVDIENVQEGGEWVIKPGMPAMIKLKSQDGLTAR